MKGQVLFVGYEAPYQAEICDFLNQHGGEACFADTASIAIRILNDSHIGTVVLNLQQLGDIAVLRYINLYYPGIKVLISASNEFDDIIDIFSKGNFQLIRRPLKLQELGVLL